MKNKFKFAAVFLVFLSTQVNAQVPQVDFYRTELNRDGIPEKYRNINGSPYLFENWALGNIKTVDNAIRKDVQLKYDEIEDAIIAKGSDDKLFAFSVPVLEFTINDAKTNAMRTFRSGFVATKANSERSFFEVLEDGKVKLLRKNHKLISESKDYSGAINRSVSEGVKYYLVNKDNSPVVVKLDQKSINAILTDKEAQLIEYTKANKLNLKNQADAAKLIAYYNTL